VIVISEAVLVIEWAARNGVSRFTYKQEYEQE